MEDSYTFKVVYSFENAEGTFLSMAKTETAAKSEFKRWLKETFPFTIKAKILYVLPLNN